LFNFGKYLDDVGIKRDWLYVPNGIDISTLKEEPLPEWFVKEVPKDKFVVAYTGTIGHANALDVLVESALLLKDNKDIVFLIVGKGKEKNRLQNIVKAKGLTNVKFLDPISKGQVISFLKKYVDVAYIGWWQKHIYSYGVSPNKLFDYMYAKKPIIHSISVENDLVSQANCGISVRAEDSQAVANSIMELYKMPSERRLLLGENGYRFLIKNFTYDKITAKLIEGVLK
jgi:glycosyltransferase involved in cell wall biosynthesis